MAWILEALEEHLEVRARHGLVGRGLALRLVVGLAIVRASITACGGEVRFANRAPGGFRAELTLAAA